MKFTMTELFNMKDGLQRLVQKEIPIKTSFKLARFTKRVNEELVILDQARVGLVERYGSKDELTGQARVDEGNVKEFIKELNEVLKIEVDIDFESIKIEELGQVTLTAMDAIVFQKVIIE